MNHIGELAQLIIACASAYNVWQTWRVRAKARQLISDVKEIKQQTDGINAQLVKVTGEAEHAKGLKEGQTKSNAERP
jgi:hypothetical protein